MDDLDAHEEGFQQQQQQKEETSKLIATFEAGTLVELTGIDAKGKQRCWNRVIESEYHTHSTVFRCFWPGEKRAGRTKERGGREGGADSKGMEAS